MALEIRPLHLGTLTVDKSGLLLRRGMGTKVPAPCLAWLVLGGPEPILVDTGPSDDPAWAARYHNPLARAEGQTLAGELARHGLGPQDIGLVVLSHLHWDHCYGNPHLPRARFVVQARELAYAQAPLPCDAPIYETDLPPPAHFLAGRERFDIVDGEHDIAEGVRVVPLPGHSPGLQGVLVRTAGGPWLIASDHFPLFENFEANVPTGLIHCPQDWYRATDRVRASGARILPGHDVRALDQERYA